jgi:DEAD/DEAH box helicase domain-containing protein
MLEKKFVEALKGLVTKKHGTWEDTIVQGSQGFRFSLPGAEYYWELQLQPQLGSAQGVSIACQPDFMLRCDNSKVKPIAIFTDGFEFHCHPVNRLADDFQKRRAVLRSGGYHVWNVTWKDLDPANAEQIMVCHQPVADRHKQFASAAKGQGKIVPDPLKIVGNGFEQLAAFIQTAHAPGWTQLATSANAYYLQQIASRRTVAATELNSALGSWYQTGQLPSLQHVEGGLWIHNERASLTSDLINYIKVDDAITNRSHQSIMVARLGDSETEVTSAEFEERWRRFLACMNLYQFLPNFHFATGSEIANGLVEDVPFEASEGLSKEWFEVREGVCSGLRHCAEELATSGLHESMIPQVEYYNEKIDDDAFAEMAWPNCNPPVAVLAGDQESFLASWQEDGWKVFTPDQLQAQGIAALIEQLNR